MHQPLHKYLDMMELSIKMRKNILLYTIYDILWFVSKNEDSTSINIDEVVVI